MPNCTKKLQEAERHLNEGRLAEAEKLTAACLAQEPRNASVQYLHGVVLVQTGRHEDGLQLIRRAVAAAPKDANMAFGLARLLERLARFGEATALFRQAVALQPKRDDYWHRLGRNLAHTGQVDEGIAALQQALTLNAKGDKALYSLGTALMGRGHNAEAEEPFEHLLELQPSNHAAWSNLGVACLQQGKIEAAAWHFSAAVLHAPNEASYHANLGIALMYAHRHEEAANALSRASQLDPKDARAFANLSVVLQDQVRYDEALKAIQPAIRLNSTPSGPWHNLLMSHFYLPNHDAEACFRQHHAWGAGIESATPLGPPRPPRGGNVLPLRVGLVSPDFRTHPVSAFIAPILETMDRRRVILFGFPQQGMRDDVTSALKARADGWHEIQSLNDQDTAALIREQEIDVLIDLAGHTTSNRLPLFARQPAPVQATYLGYPGTTGLTRIQYRLTDHHADPPGQTEKFHTEKLSRLPGSFLCYRPPAYAPAPSPAPCEARGYVTFGSFNNLKKLNSNVIAAWARVLEQMPGAPPADQIGAA